MDSLPSSIHVAGREGALADTSRPGLYADDRPGGFPPNDGTVDFYLRIRSLLPDGGVVLDLGAGRGAWLEDPCSTRRRIRDLSDQAGNIVGIDVDDAVMDNPQLSRAFVVAPGDPIPLDRASVDVVLADFVFEHITDPRAVSREIARVLRPGGWCCARTPNKWGYIAIAGRLVPNQLHSSVLKFLQPGRLERDVFPTVHRLNTVSAIRFHFGDLFINRSFYFWANLDYGQRIRLARIAERAYRGLLPDMFAPMLYAFLRRS